MLSGLLRSLTDRSGGLNFDGEETQEVDSGRAIWNQPWLFALLTFYLSHIVFCSIFGIGGTYATGSNTTVGVIIKATNVHSFGWGGHWIRLNKGQKVGFSYNAKIEKGGFSIYLSRVWPGGSMLFSKSADVIDSGSGKGTVETPEDGWYRVRIRPRNSDRPGESNYIRENMAGVLTTQDLNYYVGWRVIG
jgi:hypothetical protein